MKPTIRVIFFDLDDTLIHEAQTIAVAFAETCGVAAARYPLDPTVLEKSVRRIARERWREQQGEERWGDRMGVSSWEVLYGEFNVGDAPMIQWLRQHAPTFRLRAWASALRECGVDDEPLAHELAETYRARAYSQPALLSEAIDVLRTLQRGYRLGMITNGAPDVQMKKVESAGIRDYFEAVIISGEIGVGKPERGIFDHALQSTSSSPEESLMVGNSFERDVEGALGANMQAVWLNLLNEEPPRRDEHLHVIANLRELLFLA
jgi:putative hydrolase of the HAD superfamily